MHLSITTTVRAGLYRNGVNMIFLRNALFVSFVALVGLVTSIQGKEPPLQSHPATDAYPGWRLGVQLWSFREFTFFEAVDKVAELGLCWIEAFPGQKLGKDYPDIDTHYTVAPKYRKAMKEKLAQTGIRLVNYGVVGLPNDETECRKVFDFARGMGIETLTCEPPEEAFALIDRLCREYKIKIAIHNHPKPSHYWTPDTVLKVCQGRSDWIGACADTGHWTRSGLEATGAIRKLEDRMISLHMKDINAFGKNSGHDVIWGTGKSNAAAILAELHRQNFQGVFSVEYEHNWKNNVPDIRACVDFFSTEGAKLRSSGWRKLFQPDLSNALLKTEGSWSVSDDVYSRHGGGDLWTKESFGDFLLDFDFKLGKNSNSGVFIRTGDYNWLPWVEVQVLDSHGKKPDRHACGGIFDVMAPSVNSVLPPGDWNRMTISAVGSRITVVLNGQAVTDIDLDQWTTPGQNSDGSNNKFNVAYKDLPRSGFIGFQDHGQEIWYRNIKIKPLAQ